MADDRSIRDSLARDRTHLANERTLLAYIRTGLGFILTAALVLRFSPIETTYFLSVILLVLGFGLLIVGVFRFFKLKTKIDREKY
ncbi:MAG: hypothetical protein A3D74_02880 [Candidatus Levybacteria bacterium RIFCSPHIGHO2_02_FULL_37_13]|nr:MAG: hypothetical protein A3D74_02880 [Candidatus Levybacteria bacterium RIFCSPHIGHO2_02_FULL_37_13]